MINASSPVFGLGSKTVLLLLVKPTGRDSKHIKLWALPFSFIHSYVSRERA